LKTFCFLSTAKN